MQHYLHLDDDQHAGSDADAPSMPLAQRVRDVSLLALRLCLIAFFVAMLIGFLIDTPR